MNRYVSNNLTRSCCRLELPIKEKTNDADEPLKASSTHPPVPGDCEGTVGLPSQGR